MAAAAVAPAFLPGSAAHGAVRLRPPALTMERRLSLGATPRFAAGSGPSASRGGFDRFEGFGRGGGDMPGCGASSEVGTAVLDAGFFFGGGADKGRCGCGWLLGGTGSPAAVRMRLMTQPSDDFGQSLPAELWKPPLCRAKSMSLSDEPLDASSMTRQTSAGSCLQEDGSGGAVADDEDAAAEDAVGTGGGARAAAVRVGAKSRSSSSSSSMFLPCIGPSLLCCCCRTASARRKQAPKARSPPALLLRSSHLERGRGASSATSRERVCLLRKD